MNDYETLKKEVEALKAWKAQMENASDIPLEIDQAFRARFSDLSANNLILSSKTAGSENVGVNEGGASSYSVLGPPDGFLAIVINGTTYNLAYWS